MISKVLTIYVPYCIWSSSKHYKVKSSVLVTECMDRLRVSTFSSPENFQVLKNSFSNFSFSLLSFHYKQSGETRPDLHPTLCLEISSAKSSSLLLTSSTFHKSLEHNSAKFSAILQQELPSRGPIICSSFPSEALPEAPLTSVFLPIVSSWPSGCF